MIELGAGAVERAFEMAEVDDHAGGRVRIAGHGHFGAVGVAVHPQA